VALEHKVDVGMAFLAAVWIYLVAYCSFGTACVDRLLLLLCVYKFIVYMMQIYLKIYGNTEYDNTPS
jgi:uncharacterized membrane protein (DUF373 family)